MLGGHETRQIKRSGKAYLHRIIDGGAVLRHGSEVEKDIRTGANMVRDTVRVEIIVTWVAPSTWLLSHGIRGPISWPVSLI
jgi:hypothetical protein